MTALSILLTLRACLSLDGKSDLQGVIGLTRMFRVTPSLQSQRCVILVIIGGHNDVSQFGVSRPSCIPANNGIESPIISYSAVFSCRTSFDSPGLHCVLSLIAVHGWGGT